MSDNIELSLPKMPTLVSISLISAVIAFMGIHDIWVYHLLRLRVEETTITGDELVQYLHGVVDIEQRSAVARDKSANRKEDADAAVRLLKRMAP